MSGFENDVVFAKNADFSQGDNQNVSESNGLVTNGQMWIGTTIPNGGGTHINVGTITSPNSSATIGYSSPNITVQVNATTKITTFNADGTWTLDPRTVKVDIYAWSGGSGGGAGRNGVSGSAAGGAGGTGNFMMMSFNASGLTSSPYAVTIGQGGAGAASQNGTNTAASPGAFGTPTTLGSIFTTGNASAPVSSSGALGRYNNNGVSAPSGNNGGNGTATGGSSGDSFIYYPYASGSGGVGYTSGTPRTGLAGGRILDGASNTLVAGGTGGANTGGNGGNGNSPSADCPIHIGGSGGGAGGNDGGAVTPIAGNGGNGGFPGGGGGGGAGNLNLMASGAGGNGANGQLKIVEYF